MGVSPGVCLQWIDESDLTPCHLWKECLALRDDFNQGFAPR